MQQLASPTTGAELESLTADFSERDLEFLEILVESKIILEDAESDHLVAVRNSVFLDNRGFISHL